MVKKIAFLTFCFALLLRSDSVWGQTTIFSENFDSYASSGTLSATSFNGWKSYTVSNTSANWQINTTCTPPSATRCLSMRDGSGTDCDYTWNDSGNEIAFYATLIDATAYTGVKINFKWKAYGEPDDGFNSGQPYDYGMVCYSADGSTWTSVTTGGPLGNGKYYSTSAPSWVTVTNLSLSAVDGTSFYIGFRWINDGAAGNAPAMCVDDITVTGVGSTPAITLADNGTQVAAANVGQGSTAHVLHKISLAVTTANATLTGMQCVTAGTYISTTDITNIKVRYSADATLDAGDATLSTYTNPGAAGAKTFPSFSSQAINSGTTGYIFITADVAAGATAGNTISINSIATGDLTFSSGTKSGSSSAGGAQTIVSPSITLADNGTQVTAANVQQGTNAHVLHKISLAVTTANATLTGMQCVTAGTYISTTDITNIKVWYSSDATLDGGDATLSTYTNPGAAGAKTFPSFTSQVINSGSTGYVFITADVAPGATIGNTISINALTTGDLTFSSGSKSGSSSAGGTQTIIVSTVPNIVLSDNSTQITAGNVVQGTSGHVLHRIALAITTANATLTGLQCITAGTYISADITNLKVRYSANAILDAADATLSTYTTPGVAGTKTFPSFSSQVISSGTSGYIFITADIAAGATINNYISINAITMAHLTFSSGSLSGSSTAAGNQTFVSSSYLVTDPDVTACSGTFYDSGNSGGIYTNSENHTFTIFSTPGNCISANFSSFTTEANYDYLRVYDGPSAYSPLIGSYHGASSPGILTSIAGGGSMTFVFTSDVGTNLAGWAATISCVAGCPIPTVSLADNGTQIAANTVGQGTTSHILHKFSLAVNSLNFASLSGVACTTTGSYVAADLTNLKVRFSDDNTLNTGDATLSILTSGLGPGAKTFPSFSNGVINASDSAYIFITADIAAGATLGNTVGINAITVSDLSYFGANEIGSTTAPGLQTISNAPPNDHCSNATTLQVYTACTNTSGTSVNGTATSPALTNCSGNEDDDVWYRFVATKTDQTITVTPTGGYDVAFELRSGSCNGILFAGSCTNAFAGTTAETYSASGLTVASTYYVRVWNPNAGGGTHNICITAPFVEHICEKTLGLSGSDLGYDAMKTSDGGFIVVGASSSAGAGSTDGYIVKTDNVGNIQWSKVFGASDPDNFSSVNELSTGGYILTGISGNGFPSTSTNAQMGTNQQDGWIMKIDAAGTLAWTKIMRGSFRYQAMDEGYEVTGGSPGFLFTGANSVSGRGVDAWSVKTDLTGALLWTKTYGDAGRNENQDGSYYLSTGEYVQSGFSDAGYGVSLLKKDAAGTVLWSKSYTNTNCVTTDVTQTSDGGYLITGYITTGGAGGLDMFLLRTNSTGVFQWLKAYGGTNTDVSNFVTEASDGGYVFGGYSTSFGLNKYDEDGILVKTNNAGVVQWSKKFGEGGDDVIQSMRNTSYGGYLMSGYTSSAGAGSFDMWLIVANSLGESTCESDITASVTKTDIAAPGENTTWGADFVDGTMSTPAPSVSSPSSISGPKCEAFTPLPVELLNFNVRCVKNVVLLSWKTAMEQGNDYFTVERSSDGHSYHKIGNVNGAGNSNSVLSYSFLDKDPLPETSYYRLSQTDYNGENETFLPLSVNCPNDKNGSFAVTVNPNLIHDGNVFISIQGAADENVLVVMTDILGRELYSVMLIENADAYLHSFHFGKDVLPGLYFITASSNDKYISRKIVVR